MKKEATFTKKEKGFLRADRLSDVAGNICTYNIAATLATLVAMAVVGVSGGAFMGAEAVNSGGMFASAEIAKTVFSYAGGAFLTTLAAMPFTFGFGAITNAIYDHKLKKMQKNPEEEQEFLRKQRRELRIKHDKMLEKGKVRKAEKIYWQIDKLNEKIDNAPVQEQLLFLYPYIQRKNIRRISEMTRKILGSKPMDKDVLNAIGEMSALAEEVMDEGKKYPIARHSDNSEEAAYWGPEYDDKYDKLRDSALEKIKKIADESRIFQVNDGKGAMSI